MIAECICKKSVNDGRFTFKKGKKYEFSTEGFNGCYIIYYGETILEDGEYERDSNWFPVNDFDEFFKTDYKKVR